MWSTLNLRIASSRNLLLAATVHWISNDWILNDLLIETVELKGDHSAENIGKQRLETLLQHSRSMLINETFQVYWIAGFEFQTWNFEVSRRMRTIVRSIVIMMNWEHKNWEHKIRNSGLKINTKNTKFSSKAAPFWANCIRLYQTVSCLCPRTWSKK